MKELEIVFEQLPAGELTRFIGDSLDAHNLAATGVAAFYPVGLFLRSGPGECLGGLIGSVWGGWLHVRFSGWRRAARGGGNGTRLLAAAEDYARERGCFAATLETHSFQARPFYEKNGYSVFGSLEDYPPGHTKFFLRKTLAPAPAVS